MIQLTRQQAIAMHDGGEWRDWTDDEIVRLQLYQDRLCIPWSRFHAALENVLGRPVYTHEVAGAALREEYEGKRCAPTTEEIIAMLPGAIIIE